MSNRFQVPVGGELLTFREQSSSTKQNTDENYTIAALNALDDDRVAAIGIVGYTDGQAVTDINYSSNRIIVDGQDIITGLGALDAAVALESEIVHKTIDANITGTITVTNGSPNVVGVGTTFDAGDVGLYLRTAGGQIRKIITFTDITHVVCDSSFTTGEAGVAFTKPELVRSPKVFPAGGLVLLPTATNTPNAVGQILFDSTTGTFKGYDGLQVLTIGNKVFPYGYVGGKLPKYTSASTVTVPSGFRWVNSAGQQFTAVADIPVVLSAAGAAGLDTGAEASSTHYYLYMIRKSTDGTVSALLSVTNENAAGAITLPAGYDQKAQLPVAVRNDGSSNIIPFKTLWMSGLRAKIRYNVATSISSGAGATGAVTAGALNILNNGTAGADTSLSGTPNLIPPIAVAGDFWVLVSSSLGYIYEDGTTNYIDITSQNATTPVSVSSKEFFDVSVSAAQKIGYNSSTGHGISIDALGYLAEVA